jgi:hypothetical protein
VFFCYLVMLVKTLWTSHWAVTIGDDYCAREDLLREIMIASYSSDNDFESWSNQPDVTFNIQNLPPLAYAHIKNHLSERFSSLIHSHISVTSFFLHFTEKKHCLVTCFLPERPLNKASIWYVQGNSTFRRKRTKGKLRVKLFNHQHVTPKHITVNIHFLPWRNLFHICNMTIIYKNTFDFTVENSEISLKVECIYVSSSS